jgi:hypothetical protein
MLAATLLMADTPAAAVAATTVTPANAATANPATAAAAPAAKKADKPKLICKTEAVTGSLMPKKTCYSSDDLALRQQDERRNLERMQELSH